MDSPVSPKDLALIFPQISIAVLAIVILLVDFLFGKREKGATALFAFAAAAVTGWFAAGLWDLNGAAFGGLIVVDNFSIFLCMVFLAGCGLTIMLSPRYLDLENAHTGEYYVLLLIAALGMMVMASAGNLLTVFLGIETLSIALYALAGINRGRAASGEAALKYLLLGAFASGFLLYGIALVYGATGTFDLAGVAGALARGAGAGPLLTVGVVLLIVGMGFKASVAPFHFWAPDVYQGAPTPATAFMATGAKAAAFAVFFRVFLTALPALRADWAPVVWTIAVVTMCVANLTALWQDNVKRMLAYSSVAHAGYLLIAVLAGVEWGGPSLLFYLASYTLMNIGAFGVVAAMAGKGRLNETLDGFRGMGYRSPFTAALMTWFMLSLAGIPPTAGFVAKLYVFAAGVRADLVPLVIIAVLNAVVSVYYYLRVVVTMYMREPETEAESAAGAGGGFTGALALTVCAAGVLALGLFPGPLLKIVQAALLAAF
ncbi:MAG: NADH-quinone oxidoreductase subunit N [bacterium]